MKSCPAKICLLLVCSSMTGCASGDGNVWLEAGLGFLTSTNTQGQPAASEIGQAFKEALSIGSGNVVKQLAKADGYNADKSVHIALPGELATVKTMLGKVGLSGMTDDLELRLNRAAEAAADEVQPIFMQAIREMTFEDVIAIYKGPDDSATKYFQSKMSPALAQKMRPIVSEQLSKIGALQALDSVMAKYRAIPFVPDVNADLTDYAVQKGMDGIFFYMAREEAAIRKDPVRQTSALLKRVFGAR